MALISMVVIIITVVTQGFRVPAESRGGFDVKLLTINDGIFQAIGVISFGTFVLHKFPSPFEDRLGSYINFENLVL